MPRVVLPVKVAETGAVVNVELQNPYQDDRCVFFEAVSPKSYAPPSTRVRRGRDLVNERVVSQE